MKERSRVDYGIDLGLHHSVIARMENGEAVVKKNELQSDTTPSAVAFGAKGRIRVGQQAYNQLKSDRLAAQKSGDYQPNVFVEFRRSIGTDKIYTPAAQPDSVWTSEELSAEVLKSLLECVQYERVHAAVIAVPSEFNDAQHQAMLMAAELAGLKRIFLIKEPVAAIMALGNGIVEGEQYLIFNLGDSCFSVDLVMIGDGVMSVVDFECDYFLGGKDVDMALVDKVIIPAIQRDFDIDHILSDPGKKQTFRLAMKRWAEEAEIKLSHSDSHEVLSDLGEILVEDANGEEIELDFVITRVQMADAVSAIFQRAIDKSLALLSRHGLTGSDLHELILVGGPTFSPILRDMLTDQIKKPNTSVDPRTCVALGAALYGSTIRLADAPKNGLVEQIPYSNTGGVALDFNFHSFSLGEFEFVSINMKSGDWDGATVELKRLEWSSGEYPVGRRGAVIEVPLTRSQVNVFEVLLRSRTGTIVDCFPGAVSIIQGTEVNGLEQSDGLESGVNRPALEGEPVSLELMYDRVSDLMYEFVTVRVSNGEVKGGSIELKREGWSSGIEHIGVSGALVEVHLEKGRQNFFSVILRDAHGIRMPSQPVSIVISQAERVRKAPLPNSLGIGIWDEGTEIFETLRGAEKGRQLPVTGVYKGLRTTWDIRPGVFADSFSVRLYEGGSDAQGKPVLANDLLCEFQLTGDDVQKMIPANSLVDFTVETGPSSSLPEKVTLFFPALDIEVELEVPSVTKGQNDQAMIDRMVKECETLVSNMRSAGAVDMNRLSELETTLREVKGLFDAAGDDRGALDQTLYRLREVYREASRLSR